MGVNLDITPDQVGDCVRNIGIGFLFAPKLHGAMKHAIGPRRELGVRTIFNMLGPLTNPAGATAQVIGVFDAALTEVFAEVLNKMGSSRAMIVHGSDHLDEITLTGTTQVSELNAAAAIYVGGLADNLGAAYGKAGDAIESGAAKQKLDDLVAATS